MQKQYSVKDVAVYLRKSRGDEEDLDRHRVVLVEMCEKNNWKYQTYAEIGTSDSIDRRKQLQRLLADVKNELYDAVLVMDMDRLSRGDGEDQARIKNALRGSGTLIITPQRVYDLEDDSDDMISDFESMMARYEYKQIKKRLKRGKISGAMEGKWVNGFPPFPYTYDRALQQLKVIPEQYEIYRMIIDTLVNEKVTVDTVAIKLNKMGLQTPKGCFWGGRIISEIARDETHLGKVIYGKTSTVRDKQGRKKVTKKPRSEWIIVENCHEPVKTQEEHDLIVGMMKDNNTRKTNSKFTTLPLTGVVKCSLCGYTMSSHKEPQYHTENLKHCQNDDPFGKRCPNRGATARIVHEALQGEVWKFEKMLKKRVGKVDTTGDFAKQISKEEATKSKLERQIVRVNQLVEEEFYTVEEGKKRKDELQTKLDYTEEQIKKLKKKIKELSEDTVSKKLDLIENYRLKIKNKEITDTELNDFYLKVFKRVEWTRLGDDNPEIAVTFL